MLMTSRLFKKEYFYRISSSSTDLKNNTYICMYVIFVTDHGWMMRKSVRKCALFTPKCLNTRFSSQCGPVLCFHPHLRLNVHEYDSITTSFFFSFFFFFGCVKVICFQISVLASLAPRPRG